VHGRVQPLRRGVLPADGGAGRDRPRPRAPDRAAPGRRAGDGAWRRRLVHRARCGAPQLRDLRGPAGYLPALRDERAVLPFGEQRAPGAPGGQAGDTAAAALTCSVPPSPTGRGEGTGICLHAVILDTPALSPSPAGEGLKRARPGYSERPAIAAVAVAVVAVAFAVAVPRPL